jgi:hypothetical protein
MKNPSSRPALTTPVLPALLLSTVALHAQNTWVPGGGGSWGTSGNWSGGVPVAGDDIVIGTTTYESPRITGTGRLLVQTDPFTLWLDAHPTLAERGEDGDDDCAREPIHIPGSVQPHGLLFVLGTEFLDILQVSANSAALIGRDPAELRGTGFLQLVPPDARSAVERLVREAATTYVNPFRVPVVSGDEVKFFDGIVHLL